MSNIIISLLVLGSSVFFFVQTLSYPVGLEYERMGPGFWPKLILTGMIILSLIAMIQSILEYKKGISPNDGGGQQERPRAAGTIICGVILLFFIILIPYMGFLLSAFLSMAFLMFGLGEKNKRNVLFFSLVVVGIIYLLFGKALLVPMPRGMWIMRDLSYYLY